MKFNAFISYSHAADGKIGPALQSGLARLAKPWHKLRALQIFRDETSLSASPHLWMNIEAGLLASEYFILLASPLSASSKWVQKEINFWLTNKSPENIIIGLTDGDIAWDDLTNDFDWQQTNAIPAALKGVFTMEPLYVDFRAAHTSDDLSLQNPVFKKKVLYVAATLHKKIVEDLVSEDIEQHKKTLRIRNGAIATLSLLLLVSLVTTWIALHQTNVAREQRAIAERESRIAEDSARSAQTQRTIAEKNATMARDSASFARLQELIAQKEKDTADIQKGIAENQTTIAIQQKNAALSGFYFATALQKRDRQYDSSIYYAIKSYQAKPGIESKKGLYEMVNYNRSIVQYLYRNPNQPTSIFAGKANEVINARNGKIDFLRLKAGAAPVVKSISIDFSAALTAIDPNLQTAAFAVDNNIILWDLVKNKQAAGSFAAQAVRIMSMAFSHSGKILATADIDGRLILWNVGTRQKLFSPLIVPIEASADPMARGVMFVGFSPNDSLLVTTAGDNSVMLWQVTNGQPYGNPMKKHGVTFNQLFSGVTAAAFTTDGNYLATGGNDRQIIIWNVKTQQPVGDGLKGHDAPVTAVFFDDKKNILVSGSESGEIKFWNLSTLAAFSELDHVHDGGVTSIIKNPAGEGYISAGKDGKTILLNPFPASDRMAEKYQHALPGAQPVARGRNGLSLYPDILRKISLSGSGNLLASGSDDGVLVLWDRKTHRAICRKKLFREKLFSIEFDQQERYLAAGGYDENLFLYNLQTGEESTLRCGGKAIGSIGFNNSGGEAAVGTVTGLCYILDVGAKKIKSSFQSGNSPVSLVAFVNNGSELLTCNTTGVIRISGQDKAYSFQLDAYESDITINGSKNIIAFRQKNQVQLLKINGHHLQPMGTVPLPQTTEYGTGLSINNDGSLLAVVTGTTIAVYDVKTGQLLVPVLSGLTSINSVSMTDNGRQLAADVSGNVQVWGLDFNAWIEKSQQVTGF